MTHREPLDMDLINQRNEQSFHLLFSLYYKALVGFADSMVGSADDAEDIVQEFMAFLVSHEVTFTSRSSLEGYLYTSVRHRCLNHIKHRNVENNAATQAERKELTDDDDEWLLTEQLYQRLFATIDLLPPRSRDVVLLVAEGKSNQQIASVLGMSVETVKTHKKRSMAFLRDKMDKAQWVFLLALIGIADL